MKPRIAAQVVVTAISFVVLLLLTAAAYLPLCTAHAIELSADSFILSFDDTGQPASCHRKTDGAEFLQAGNVGQGFYLTSPDTAPVHLKKLLLLPDGQLSARSDDGTKEVIFRVTHGQR